MCKQDNARSFAGNASDEEKYNLYMAATGFDAVLRGLAASEAQVGAWKERLRTVQEQLKVRGPCCTPLSFYTPGSH